MIELTTYSWVVTWFLPSLLIAIAVGYSLGRMLSRTERARTLKALLTLLQSTEELNRGVESHNVVLDDARRVLKRLDLPPGDLHTMQHVILREIVELRQSNQKLEDDLMRVRCQMQEKSQELDRTRQAAATDSLSGVANRKAFDEALNYWLSAFRRRGKPFFLALIDVDHFKWINDTHGHNAGDRVVRQVGSFLKEAVSRKDYVARFGGDEFAILMRADSLTSALEHADRIRSDVGQRNFNAGGFGERLAVTFSVGVAEVRKDDTAEGLLERADRALYRSKQQGRNQVHCHAEEPQLTGSAT